MIAWTAKWSSMIFSFIGAPGAEDSAGRNEDTGTSFFPGNAREGGLWYDELRKNESHDWKHLV